MSFHILIHYKQPAFVTEDGSPDTAAFTTHSKAQEWASQNRWAQRLGYTILEWDDAQGGNGVIGTTSYP